MKKTRILILIIGLIAASGNVFAQHNIEISPVKIDLTAAEWREDLRYFAEELPKRHKNAFHAMTREQFAAAVKQFNEEIPRLKSEEIYVGFMRLIAMFGDGHTSIQESTLFNFGFYPVRYEIYADGLFVQSASSEYAGIVGGRVVKIDDVPVEKAISQIRELAWGDNHNEQSKKVETAFLLMIPKVLQGLKIANGDGGVKLTVEKDGQLKTAQIKTVTDVQNFMKNAKRIAANDNSTNPVPLYLKDADNLYRFEYVKDAKILYVQFNAVQNKPDESVAAFFKKVFDFAENNPVDKFVLDVRNNTGGNNGLNKPIVVGMIKGKFNERGKLFVIIGRRTFSAAQNLVNEIEKYTNAIFVGEPTGSSPNLYGDPSIVTLPNSKLPFRVSTLWHQIDPRDTRIWTSPEIYAELTSEDYRSNRDTVFQTILEYTPGSVFKDLTAEAANDIPGFIKKYREFKTNPKNRFVDTESDTNALGYRLLQAQRAKDAIEIFKLNTESYPNSANVYDSLAEAYAAAGNRAEAVKNYEKALKINPNFTSSLDALKKLK